MTIIVANDQTIPSRFTYPISTNNNIGPYSLLLLGILPALLAGLVSTTPRPCPVCTPCDVPTPCPVPICPAECEPIPVCPIPFVKLSAGGTTIPNKCFLFVTADMPFANALAECTKRGGSLLNIQTPLEGQAVREHLRVFFPDNDMYIGYTDFGTADATLIGLSGGPIPLPEFGDIPTPTNDEECLLIRVKEDNVATTEYNPCTEEDDYICEINLGTQKCTCP